MTPEQKARVSIDALLVQAGWHVCNVADANIHAATGVAIREFPLNNGFGLADYLLYVNGKACGVIAFFRPDLLVQWLAYAFYNYRLLHVALMQVHVAGEAAIKARAKLEGVDSEKSTLKTLLDMALSRRWLLDVNFEVVAGRAEREAEHLEMLRFVGIAQESFVRPLPEQDFAKGLVEAFRHIRNALAHGVVLLKPNLSWEFMAVRNLTNQLFPNK